VHSSNAVNSIEAYAHSLADDGGRKPLVREFQNQPRPFGRFLSLAEHFDCSLTVPWFRMGSRAPYFQPEGRDIVLGELNEIFFDCDVAPVERLRNQNLQIFGQVHQDLARRADLVGHGCGGLYRRGHLRES